ncbi:MAG TPA: hydrolase [Bacteroidales bacterium]|nr:hydrolase [Bacteroidales bacterium]
MEEEICCPKFDPKPWDETTHVWKDKLFITDTIKQFMHMPLPGQFGKVMTRMQELTKKCGVEVTDLNEFIVMSYDPSPWKSDIYMTVSGEHPDLKNTVKLSGTFLSKVFDGPYNHIPKYMKETESFVQKQGFQPKKYYFYYTTCPKCAKKYGHNYIVVLVEV